jgi:transketolase
MSDPELDQLCINTIRTLSMDAVEQAKSGHPGMPMGAAAMAYVLWTRFLKHNPADPTWPDRDRFVLSAGHGCMLLYSLLHLTGYEPLGLDELQRFRQWGSRTPGHPEYGWVPGVETTTGPLGQGFANGVGMAIAERMLAARFNRPGHTLVDHYTYGLVSDGDLMEGISAEAASLAGHLRLGKLICLYDDNKVTIEGSTDLAFTEDVGRRFEAYGWQVQRVDGNNLAAVEGALRAARAEADRPTLIVARTHLGFGSPHKQDTAEAHGAPLGEEEVRLTKKALGWPEEARFYVPGAVLAHMRRALDSGRAAQAVWRDTFTAYRQAYPELALEWERVNRGDLPAGWAGDLPAFAPSAGPMATREASGKVLNALAPRMPELVGGSADLAPSTLAYLAGLGDFSTANRGGRNLRFGVREHAMGAILSGMALHAGLRVYGGTFLVFSDYMRPAIRLAALMDLPVTYVFTHDSIGLGEDGPTHQPVEQLAALRAIPHLTVIRPADANETVVAWRVALSRKKGPVALILSRQKLPILEPTAHAAAGGLECGAYVLADAGGKVDLILIATGSEVALALGARLVLEKRGIGTRVVSMPCWELFDAQPQTYREAVLPTGVTARLAIEAGVAQGWSRYVGAQGEVLSIERFGASAPYNVLFQEFGFTVENVVERALAVLKAAGCSARPI